MLPTNEILIDEPLAEQIAHIARARGVSPAEVVRQAIAHYWGPGETWGTRAQRIGLVGCVEDAPADLSTNPSYFNGFGRG